MSYLEKDVSQLPSKGDYKYSLGRKTFCVLSSAG